MSKHDEKQVLEEEENLDESAVEDEVVKLREEVNALQEAAEETENKYKRALADYQNLQKRSQDDRLEWIKSANKDLLLRILTVFDTLVMAYQHIQDKNLEVSIQHFLDVLKSEGVTRIKTEGQKFDPLMMEAIAIEDGEDGKVIAETRAGFLIHDKLLRPAQVTVGQTKE